MSRDKSGNRTQEVVGSIPIALRSELVELKQRVQALEQRIADLEVQL